MVFHFVVPWLSYAQTNDDMINRIMWDVDRWYTDTDKQNIRVIAKSESENTVTLKLPTAVKDGEEISTYYIARSPLSFTELQELGDSSAMEFMRDSTQYESGIYRIENGFLLIDIEVDTIDDNVYVSIVPEYNQISGNPIYDYNFEFSSVEITPEQDVNNSNPVINQPGAGTAIVNLTCVWDQSTSRVTLFRDVNTAFDATKVQIASRDDTSQWNLRVEWTPNILDKRFVIDWISSNSDLKLFALKPLNDSNAQVGNEIHYECKYDPVEEPKVEKPEQEKPIPEEPSKPIPVVPETWPKETTAIVLIIALLAYGIYRGVRKAN